MKKKIEQLENHIVLCGAGDTGKEVMKELLRAKKPFVVIEEKTELVQELQERYPQVPILQGDATTDELLLAANIKRASALITALSLDADNLFVVVSARALNPNLLIVSRSVNASTQNKLYKAGANYVISPNVVEGTRMASVILRPTVVSFLEVMIGKDDMSLRMEEVDIPPGSALDGKTLKDAQIPQKTGLIVIAIKQATTSKWIFNPKSDFVLHHNDQIVVLGDEEKIYRLRTLLDKETLTLRD